MVKINLIRLSVLVVACFLAIGTTNAQTKVWGAGAAVGVADGEFQNNFIQAGSFTAGDNPTAWTALSISHGGPNNTVSPGAAYWTRSLTGSSQGAYWGTRSPISSPSQANGVAIFDSDFMDNGGDPNAQGNGTAVADQHGELISPRIDLQGYTNSALVLQFYTYFRDFDIDAFEVAMSVDDGLTWSPARDFKNLAPDEEQTFIRLLFKSITANVANLSQCRIKFSFVGNYYFAMIDDVTIEIAPEYDIAIGIEDLKSNFLNLRGTTVKVGSNRFMPLNNIIHSNDRREWFWGARAVNDGGKDILPSANPRLYLSIDHVDAVSGTLTPDVYLDTVSYDTLVSGAAAGDFQIEDFRDIAFIQTYGAGRYEVTYWVDHDSLDGNPANDTSRHFFTITDNTPPLTNYISKVPLNQNGDPAITGPAFTGTPTPSSWEWGSVYFFPRGATDSICIDSVRFRYYVPTGFSGSASQTLFCNIAEINPTNRFINNDNMVTQIGVSTVSLTDLNNKKGTYNAVTARDFRDAGTNGPMSLLKDNGFYYISVLTSPSLTGGNATFNENQVPWYGMFDNRNYDMNIIRSSVDSIISFSPMRVVDGTGVVNWYGGFEESNGVPSIGVHLRFKSFNPLSVSTVWETKGAELSVYPNPTSDVLNVDFSLEEANDVMYIITDMAGRVLNVTEKQNITKDFQTVDVSNFAPGVYMITARTNDGVYSSTERFIIK